MYRLYAVLVLACLLLAACANQAEESNQPLPAGTIASSRQEGKDYLLLKRFRLRDNQGFNQPVEASSFLLPADWQLTGSVEWNATNKCIAEIVQAPMQAISPGGEYELIMLPVTQFDWTDDPVYMDAMKRGFNLHSCTIAPPRDAAGYISESLAPYMQAQAKTVSGIAALQQQMDAGAQQLTNAARQAGNNAYSHRGSAAEGILQFNDGKEGLAFCTLMQTVVAISGTQGNMAEVYQCYVSMRIVLKYPPGNEAMARKIMSVFFSSAKINPQWANAVQGILAGIGSSAQAEIGKQIEIAYQAQQEISNNIVRSWENSQRSNSTGENSTAGFSQYLRGVQSWTDEQGNQVELTDGYSNAWSKGDGSYLLSNDPAFDPNTIFKESWNRLSR